MSTHSARQETRRQPLVWTALPALFVAVLTLALPSRAATKKVLLVAADAVRQDILQQVFTPRIDALVRQGVLQDDATTRPDTLTGPGMSSILTGVWQDKHGVIDDSFAPPTSFDIYPNFLARMELVNPDLQTIALASWRRFNVVLGPPIDFTFISDGDDVGWAAADMDVLVTATQMLENQDPAGMFIYFAGPSVAGGEFGPLSPEYATALRDLDSWMGQLVDTIEARATYADEDWLILLATDHGLLDDGGHLGFKEQEARVFFLASGQSVVDEPEFDRPASNVDFAATALAHVLGDVDPAWDLDGQALALRSERADYPTPDITDCFVSPSTALSWHPGLSADSHDVYFGTAPLPGPAEFLGNQVSTDATLTPLQYGTRYSWRIDEVQGGTPEAGVDWSFTTDTGLDLIGYWNFDEAGGSIVGNSAADCFDGKIIAGADPMSGSGWEDEGLFGYSYTFGGEDGDWVEVEASAAFQRNDALSISFWAYVRDYDDMAGLVSFGRDSGPRESGFYFYTTIWQGFGLAVSREDDDMLYLEALTFSTRTWHHVVATWDGERVSLYVNGELEKDRSLDQINYDPEPWKLFFGRFHSGEDDLQFDGDLDDIGFWRRALDEDEVDHLYNGGVGRRVNQLPRLPPKQALNPYPADGAEHVALEEVLRWTAGGDSQVSEVFLAPNRAPVPPDLLGSPVDHTWPVSLQLGTSYQWKVNDLNTSGLTEGIIWEFTTLPAESVLLREESITSMAPINPPLGSLLRPGSLTGPTRLDPATATSLGTMPERSLELVLPGEALPGASPLVLYELAPVTEPGVDHLRLKKSGSDLIVLR